MATHTDNGGTFFILYYWDINSQLNISIKIRILEATWNGIIKVEHFSFWRALLLMTIDYAELREKV